MAYRPLQCTARFEDGYWWDNAVVAAVDAGTVPGDTLEAFPCPQPAACIVASENRSMCAEGYSGIFCGTCMPGFGMSGSGACSRCWHPAASWALLITVLAAFGVAGYLGVRRVVASRQRLQLPDGGFSRETTVTAKILMNFLQTVSFLGDFELQWTPEVSSFFAGAAATSGFTTDSAFVSCALGWAPLSRFTAAAVMVPMVVLLPAMVIASMAWRHRRQEFRRADEDETYVPVPLSLAGVTPLNLYTTTALFMLFLIYPMVTRQALQIFVCTRPVGGERLLVADLGVRCGSDLHQVLVVCAWAVLTLVTAGFPVAVVACLWPYRASLRGLKAQRRFGFLYKGYRDSRFWYESVILVRKASVAAVSVLLRLNSPTLQLWAGILVQLLFLGGHVAMHPYQDRVQGWLEMGCIIAAILVLVLGQGLAIVDLGPGAAPALSASIMGVALSAVGVCLSVIAFDVYRMVAQASFAQRAVAAWKSGKTREMVDEGALATEADRDGPELGTGKAGAGHGRAGRSSPNVRPGASLRAVASSVSWLSRRGLAARAPETAGSSGGAHGFSFRDLPNMDGKGGPQRRASRPGGRQWRPNEFHAAVVTGRSEAATKLETASRGGSDSVAASTTTSANPLAKLRRSKSGILRGINEEVHQTGLVRRRQQHHTGDAGMATGSAVETAASTRARFGGVLLPNSPWAATSAGQTAVASSAARTAQAARQQRSQVLISQALKDERAEVESRWKEAVHPVWGTTYWYNRKTRQITWEMPAELEALALKEEHELSLWKRQEHPSKRIAFWSHPTLGKRWHRPIGVPLRPEEAWWRAQLPESGVPYFVNLLTRETEWERPAGYVYTPTQLMHESLRPLVAALQTTSTEAAGVARASSPAAAAHGLGDEKAV